jgi:hypothetical protein
MIRESVWVLHFSLINMKMCRTLVVSYQHQLLCTSLKIMRRMEHIQVSQGVVFTLFNPPSPEKKPKNNIITNKLSAEI